MVCYNFDKGDIMEKLRLIGQEGKIKEVFVKYLEARYHCKLPEEVEKVFSVCNEDSIFYGEETGFRILSQDEVLMAKDEWFDGKTDFIPLIDYYDNDFLVYITANKKWGLYNMSDNLVFKEFAKFHDFLDYFNRS